MATSRKLEDIDAWQKARQAARMVYEITRVHDLLDGVSPMKLVLAQDLRGSQLCDCLRLQTPNAKLQTKAEGS